MTPIKITLPERGYYLSAQIGARFCIIEPHKTLDRAFFVAASMPSGDLWKTPQAIDASEVEAALERLWKVGGKRQAVYARKTDSLRDRIAAADRLTRDPFSTPF